MQIVGFPTRWLIYQNRENLILPKSETIYAVRIFYNTIHSYIHRQNIAPMELAQLGNKSQKISCSFQLLSSLSVNCENNKSNIYQISRGFRFFSFLLDHFMLEFYISSLWVLIYMVTHICGYLKFGSTYKFL